MLKSKLFDLLALLNPQELAQLRRLVNSPYFNKHENTRLLLDFILEVGIDNEDPDLLSKEAAFKVLFPGEKYQVQKIKDIMSPLTKLVETQIIQTALEANPDEQSIYLMRVLRERRSDKYFEVAERQLRQRLEQNTRLDGDHFWMSYQLETEADNYFMSKLERTQHASLQARADNLDRFYLLSKLRMSCEMINRTNIIKAHFDLNLIDAIRTHMEENLQRYTEAPVVIAYYYNLLALMEPAQEEHYNKLVQFLDDNTPQLGEAEARSLYDYAKNYCIKKINSGNSLYLQRLFEVYKSLLENRLIYQGPYLSQWDYKNIVTVATRLKQFDWCLDFMQTEKDNLEPQHRHNAYTYNLAMYHFSKAEYDQAMDLLRDVEFTDVYYNIGGKITLLKIYFELDEIEAFFNMIEGFKAYLNRNKLISEYQHTVNSNLLRFAKRLARLKRDQSITAKAKFGQELKSLKAKVDATPQITNIDWLREKMDELAAEIAVES